jgi:hypothetical protein
MKTDIDLQPIYCNPTVFAVDPGKATGIAIMGYDTSRDIHLFLADEVPWDDIFKYIEVQINWWYDYCTAHEVELVVVCESFRLYANKQPGQIQSDFPSVQVIGAIKSLEARLGFTMVLQPASSRKRVQILPQHKDSLKGPHRKDAYMHGRLYLVTQVKPYLPPT